LYTSTFNRFEIADRKGLEITILATLLTFQDLASSNNAPSEPNVLSPPSQAEAPPPPPRPAPKTGVDRIAEMHAMRYEPNEVTVNEEGSIENYGEYAEGLLAVCRHTRILHIKCFYIKTFNRMTRCYSSLFALRHLPTYPKCCKWSNM
jgi:hypothetical protein